MRTQLTLVGWLGVAVMASASLAGTPSSTVGVGARQLGMGGAYVGLADDAHAIYWNPAGLPKLQRQEFSFSYMPNRLINGLNTGYGAATIPLGERQAIGADLFYETYSDPELSFTAFNLRASYGVSLVNWFSAGVNLKYVAPLSVKYNNIQVDDPRGLGLDIGAVFDAGLLIPHLEGLRLGFMARDVSGTSVKFDNDFSEKIYPASYTVGASYKLGDNLTLAADLDDRAHFGVEYSLFNLLALRAGVQRDVRGYSSEMYYSGGMGLRYRGLKLDYAYTTHPVLDPTHYVTLSFAYNPSYVTIRDAKVVYAPLFRALYRYYEAEPDFAEVTLKNTSQQPLKVSVGISVPTMMQPGKAHSQDYTLPPQSTQTVKLGVTMDDSLLLRESSNYDNLVQPEVFVNYQQERETKRANKRLTSLYVLGRNKMTWENPLRICAFVTPEHRSVIEFGDRTIREFRTLRDEVFDRCPNLGTAMLIYDALGKYGIAYNPDQTTPFYKLASDTSNMRTIFDTIKYPVQTFRSHLGDCDDLSVIFVSLMEQQNIPTALLDVFDPVWGHVYMMFDSGLTPEEAMRTGLFLSEDEFVTWTDPGQEDLTPHAWIPVETTMFGHLFTEAWKSGIDEYREKMARNYIRAWSVSQGKQEFNAGVVDSFAVPFPDVEQVRQLLELDIAKFRQRLELPPLEPPITPEKLYGRGVELIERSQYVRAIETFTEALAMRSDYADAYNGRGVAKNDEGGRVRYMSDDPARRRQEAEGLWRAAVEDFKAAIRINPREPGYWVNLMIAYRLLNSTEEASQARQQALELDEQWRPILDSIERSGE